MPRSARVTTQAGGAGPRKQANFVVHPATTRRRKRWLRRQNQHRLIDWLAANSATGWDGITNRRQAGCGRRLIDGSSGVELRATETDDGINVYPVGLQTCGSTWLCPVCASKIRARRAIEVQLAAMTHTANGGTLAMLTLTVRHNRRHSLDELVAGLRDAWRSVEQYRRWRTLRSELVGTIVALEVTHGPNGWHPHLHILLFLNPGASAELDELRTWLPEGWRSRVANRLGVAPTLAHGVHLLELDATAAAYVSKIGDETTRADLKSDATNPFSLLDNVRESSVAMAKWLEYSAVMRGKNSLRWSRGLKAELLPDVEELTDEELAAAVVNGHLLEVIDGKTWAGLVNGRTELGVVTAVRYLEQWERRLSTSSETNTEEP